MTFQQLFTLLAIVIGGGIAIAVLLASKSDGNRNFTPMYGYALLGGSVVGWSPATADAPDSSDAEVSTEQSGNTSAVRANLIVVGRDIFFDENNNRQPEPSERFLSQGNAFEVPSADGLSRYRMTNASLGLRSDFVSRDRPQFVLLHVDVVDSNQSESVVLRQSGKINVYVEPVDHGWAHFGGPLTMELIGGEHVKLPASGGPTIELRTTVFTPAVQCSTNEEGQILRSNPTSVVPGIIFPTATIEFPTDSGEPITRRYDLDQFC